MEIQFDTYDPNTDVEIAPGKAHILINDVDEQYKETCGTFNFTVLAHEKDKQKGKESINYVATSVKSAQNRANLFICAGLTTREELIDKAKETGTPISISMEDLVGRQVLCRFNEDEEGRSGISYNSWRRVDDPACDGWPKNKAVLDGYEVQSAGNSETEEPDDDF